MYFWKLLFWVKGLSELEPSSYTDCSYRNILQQLQWQHSLQHYKREDRIWLESSSKTVSLPGSFLLEVNYFIVTCSLIKTGYHTSITNVGYVAKLDRFILELYIHAHGASTLSSKLVLWLHQFGIFVSNKAAECLFSFWTLKELVSWWPQYQSVDS